MRLKRTVISIFVGSVVFGLNYQPAKDLNQNPAAFLSGFGWGGVAHASDQCETEEGGFMACDDMMERIGVIGTAPPDFWEPDPVGDPECQYDCGSPGGDGGGGTSPEPSVTETLAQESVQQIENNLLQIANELSAIIASIDLDTNSRLELMNAVTKLNAFVTLLQSGVNISYALIYNELENLGPEILGLIFGFSATVIASAALTTLLGTTVAGVVGTFIGVSVASWAVHTYVVHPLWNRLQVAYENGLIVSDSSWHMPDYNDNQCPWHGVPAFFCDEMQIP
ncbi:hypothetical protein CWE13_10410 [Aliidiomarina shirensis]|uniref:Uncharacterized protein n=1 Tax=Aliidiomarina shirensis TaxID=1048642 RepID=A0A432WQA0_9GAMM|nr:hypothetical protein [Aliidiomarina shirensis]RUO35950.1 hypothetical protein CWE13_10410 [Aliidiomarina shirensis]